MSEVGEVYPRGRVEREALRGEASERYYVEAELRSLRHGRSLKCQGETNPDGRQMHADVDGGCANDGSSCLCPCHDSTGELPHGE